MAWIFLISYQNVTWEAFMKELMIMYHPVKKEIRFLAKARATRKAP